MDLILLLKKEGGSEQFNEKECGKQWTEKKVKCI